LKPVHKEILEDREIGGSLQKKIQVLNIQLIKLEDRGSKKVLFLPIECSYPHHQKKAWS
jgi:hypothetical protein